MPLVLQFGASFDFVVGKVDRAPAWMQRTGLEWLHRTLQEPKRLAGRYAESTIQGFDCGATGVEWRIAFERR